MPLSLRSTLRTLPQGTLAVGGGLLTLGVSAYLFLALAGRALHPDDYSALSVLWAVVFTVGPGIFLPLEQEVGRLVAHREVRGEPIRPVVVRASALAAGVLAVLVLALALSGRWLADEVFAGNGWMVVDLALCIAVLWAAHLSRGVLAGSGLFGRYGVQLGVDGVLRFVGAGALLAAGVGSPAAYGALLAIAPIIAVVATFPRHLPRLPSVDESSWSSLGSKLGLLLGASLVSQVLANVGVVAAQLIAGPGEGAAAGSLLSALVIARVPVFLYAAVQASLLPRLSASVAVGDARGFAKLVSATGAAMAALGGLSVLGSVLLGPWLMQLLFATQDPLGRIDFLLLSTATALFIVANVAGQSLVALDRHGDQLAGWLAGLVVTMAVLLLGHGLLARIEWSMLLGTAVTLAVLAGLLWLHRPHPGTVPTTAAATA